MPADVIDSAHVGASDATAELHDVASNERSVQCGLDVETALGRAPEIVDEIADRLEESRLEDGGAFVGPAPFIAAPVVAPAR